MILDTRMDGKQVSWIHLHKKHVKMMDFGEKKREEKSVLERES